MASERPSPGVIIVLKLDDDVCGGISGIEHNGVCAMMERI